MNTDILQDYIFMRVDGLRLIMAQDQMTQIAHITNREVVNRESVSNSESLLLGIAENKNQFLALSETLQILPAVPENRFIQSVSEFAANVHWCWNEVQLLNSVNLNISPIPISIKSDDMPVDGIVTLADGNVAFTCDVKSILQYAITNTDRGHHAD